MQRDLVESPGQREVEVFDDRTAAKFGGLQDSFQSTIRTLEQFSLDEQTKSVFEGEFVVVGVLSLFEQSRRHGGKSRGLGALDSEIGEHGSLVDELTRRLNAQLAFGERPGKPDLGVVVPAPTKFIELALNIIDPDDAWDPEETLEFSDAAKVYLDEYPITHWEIEGTFSLVAQFLHDWTLGNAHVEDGTSHRVGQFDQRIAFRPVPSASASKLERPQGSLEAVTGEIETEEWLLRTSLETVDPLSGTTLRMMFGDSARVPTLALFVGEDEDPILIDCSALEIAIEQWRETVINCRKSALSFRSNSDHELEAFDLDFACGSTFE